MAQTQAPLQTQAQAQPEEEEKTLIDAQEVQFWLAKVVFWGQAESPDTQRDTCLHLSRLKEFLQLLLSHISNVSSTTEAMRKLPFLGQVLGRLCWNPCVTADAEGRSLLFQSMWCLYSEEPSNVLERKANQWIRNVLCQLATEEDGSTMQALVKHMGFSSTQYHLRVLRKTVGLLLGEIGKNCSTLGTTDQRCSCDHVLAASQACIPLVTCPEAAPLIGALLQRPVTCLRETLCQDFLNAVSSAYSSQRLVLEEQALVSLWRHDLPSLEGAALSLVESALATPHNIEQQLAQSVLPKACSVHCSLFLVVNDIFRSILKQVEGSHALLSLLSSFTICFLRELTLLQSQGCMSLKAFFPSAPRKLLVPLLTQPSEMSREAWKDHLNWLSGSMQRLTQEEEDEDEKAGEDGGARGRWTVFEAWFLLAQCAHWVEVAVQLLASADPEDCGELLWLLTFYQHPTNRGHHRTLQLAAAREVWERLRSLFLASTGVHQAPSPLQPLVELLSCTERPSPAPLLILSLLLSFAVHSTLSLSGATEIVRTVVEQSGAVDEAVCVLSSMEFRLNGRGCLSTDANSVQFRIKALREMLAHTQTSAENPTRAHS